MANLKLGGLLTQISGKLGGQSIANLGNYATIKNITQRNKRPTQKQARQRFVTSSITNLWSNLTQTQRDSFSAAAADYTWINNVGVEVVRNGFTTFCFLNQNLHLIGIPLNTTAPAYVPVTVPKINIIDISSGNFEIQSNNATSVYLYAIFGIANLPFGVTASGNHMKFLGTLTAAQLNAGYDVVSMLEAVYGTLSFPNKMAITVDPINQTTGNRNQYVTVIENIDKPMILELTVADGDSVTIPFISSGTYNGSINWNDGNVTTFNTYNSVGCTHVYVNGGTYRIVISGVFQTFSVGTTTFSNYLSDIIQFGTNVFKTLNFRDCTLLTYVSCLDTPTFDTLADCQYLFFNCSNITFVNNLNLWDVTNVGLLSSSFRASSVNQDLNSWDVSNITGVASMFRDSVFDSDISTWMLNSVISCIDMFRGSVFNQPIPYLVGSSVISIPSMFRDNNVFNQDLSNWDVSNVSSFGQLFRVASAFSQDLSSWDISSATDMLNFGVNANFTDSQFDNMLNAWAALPLPPSNIVFRINATHTAASSAAYTTLTTTYSWTITEG